MVYVSSPFPWQNPSWTNYHNVLLRMSPPSDYVMYVDAVTRREITRYEFNERVRDAATALGAPPEKGGLGLGKNGMVALLSDNCIDFSVIVHALLVITTPFALFSSYATPHELKHYFNKSNPTHIFVHASLFSKLLPVAREEGLPLENIFILEGTVPSDVDAKNMKSLDALVRHAQTAKIPREPVRHAEKDTLAYLVFSSGTSGLSKAVMISHGNLVTSLLQGVITMMEYSKVMPPIDPNFRSITLGFLPFFHSFGLHYLCLKTPARASTVILMPRWNLELALKCIPKYKITHLALIPSVIHNLVSSNKLASTDMSSIIGIGSGAAYLPPALADKFSASLKGISISEGYGMSEATLSLIGKAIPGILNGTVDAAPNATGILVPNLEAIVLRPDGTHCLYDEPGDLYVRGDCIALGYWNDAKATKEAFFPGGWLRTGDRFRVNAKGTFFFADRAKDTLKVSGMQVAPAEIEDVILAEPSGIVNDVAVAGVNLPTARTSDDKCPRAWVVLTPKGKQAPREEVTKIIDDWVKKNLSKYKWLRGGIEYVDEIPKNPTGKIMRRLLTEKYETSLMPSRL